MTTSATLHIGDALTVLRTMPAESVHCVVTSPPYWGLRDYGTGTCDHVIAEMRTKRGLDACAKKQGGGGSTPMDEYPKMMARTVCPKCGARRADQQLGLEATPADYLARMVELFEEVRRVLRDDGVCWMNMGDGYMHKNLIGMPWRLALALQDAGWWLRSDCIWHKLNPMPESVTDRPTKSHEYVFLLTKSERYFWDGDAVREPAEYGRRIHSEKWRSGKDNGDGHRSGGGSITGSDPSVGRNIRTVWSIATQPFSGGHFATFPEELVRRCVAAGSRLSDIVLDPFAGAGTTGVIALRMGRSFIGVELKPEYAEMARSRIVDDAPMFNRCLIQA